MKNRKLKKFTVIIIVLLLLSGCGDSVEVAPCLLEPIVKNDLFRRVDKGGVYDVTVLLADVVPQEYGAFFNEAAKVDLICVDLGDYVEEGAVLARMNTKALEQELSVIDNQIKNLKNTHYYEELIADEKINGQKLLLLEEAASASDAVADREQEIGIIRENKRYDNMLYEHRLKALEDRRESLMESIDGSTLKAVHSGYVSYIKKLSGMNYADAFENIVIVSDYDELSIEISEDMSQIKNYEEALDKTYVMLQGQKIALSIKPYSHEECAAMDNAGSYPRIKYTFSGIGDMLDMGDKLPVYIEKPNNDEVLRIGRDSLFTDGNTSYVYVKTESGKEKREIVTGREGSYYVEVKEGLLEGEWVSYTSEELMPVNYKEFEVLANTISEEAQKVEDNGLKRYTISYPYSFEKDIEATVYELSVKKDALVKCGDLICVLCTKYGYAKRLELYNRLKEAQTNKEKGLKVYEEQLKDVDTRIKKCRKEGKLQEVKKLQVERNIIEYDMEIAKISYDEAVDDAMRGYEEAQGENDGEGFVNIYAEHDGYIGQLDLYEGKQVEAGALMFTIYEKDSIKLAFKTEGGCLGVGSEVSITLDGKKTYKKRVIGNQGDKNKFYVGKKGGKTYITKTEGGDYAYLDPSDIEGFGGAKHIYIEFSQADIKDAIAIPNQLLHEETVYAASKSTQYYVYKIDDGILVKQWVYIGDKIKNKNMVYILDGLKEGDILADDREDKK